MTLNLSRALGVLLGIALVPGVSQAQSPLPTAWVQAGPALTVHIEGEQYFRASPPLEGVTVGGVLAVGARFAPEVGAEVAVTLDGTQSEAQSDRYFYITDYVAESRDVVIDVNLRYRPRGGSRLEVSAGGGWVYTRFARREQVTTVSFPSSTITGPDVERSSWAPTANGVVAMALPLSPRVELVPAVGARWTRRESGSEAWYLGVGRVTVLTSVALRLKR